MTGLAEHSGGGTSGRFEILDWGLAKTWICGRYKTPGEQGLALLFIAYLALSSQLQLTFGNTWLPALSNVSIPSSACKAPRISFKWSRHFGKGVIVISSLSHCIVFNSSWNCVTVALRGVRYSSFIDHFRVLYCMKFLLCGACIFS